MERGALMGRWKVTGGKNAEVELRRARRRVRVEFFIAEVFVAKEVRLLVLC